MMYRNLMLGSQTAVTEEASFKVTFQTPFSNPEAKIYLSMHQSTTLLSTKENSYLENSN